jgi:hypothetical protein
MINVFQNDIFDISEQAVNDLKCPHYNSVPADKNSSERAIRNIKVKHKISDVVSSTHWADGFAVLRFVIDTTIKSGQNVFFAIL